MFQSHSQCVITNVLTNNEQSVFVKLVESYFQDKSTKNSEQSSVTVNWKLSVPGRATLLGFSMWTGEILSARVWLFLCRWRFAKALPGVRQVVRWKTISTGALGEKPLSRDGFACEASILIHGYRSIKQHVQLNQTRERDPPYWA